MDQRFRQGVYAVVESRDLILCDLPADQFYLLPEMVAGSDTAATFVSGLPLASDGVALLAEAGLIEKGGSPARAPIIRARREICPSPLEHRGPVGAARWRDFCVAGIEAAYRLRVRRFEAAPGGVARRDGTSLAVELGALEYMLRLVPGVRRCLPRALVIRAFLRRRGLRLTLIFAVRADPFEAHCWLMDDDAVVGDRLDYIAGYIPVAQL